MISVLILTKNEVEVLEDALQSVSWCDDVHVFDSFSDDGTQALARRMGATVTERQFDGYASQRNAALTEIPFRHEWIFILDADERPSVELSREMQERVADAPASVAAFRVRRRDFLWGTWLKHAQITPTYLRLVRRGHARYSREVNEHLDIDGAVAEMRAPLEHYPFSKGMSCWVERHNRYSTMEAELLVTGAATAHASPREALLGKTPQSRRAAQKAIFYKVPFRPLFKWAYMMFWRGALLDGPAGWTYAGLQTVYEYLIEVKRQDLLRRRTGPGKRNGTREQTGTRKQTAT